MSYVLAIEPHPEQAGILSHAVRRAVHTTLTVVDSLDAAIAAIDDEVPHLVLVPSLMPPNEESELLTRLREFRQDTAPQILVTPALAPRERQPPPRPRLFQRLRARDERPEPCDPSAFADQISVYLNHADRRRYETWQPESVRFGPGPGRGGADRRAAVRFERLHWVKALVDGAPVDLVDLSVTGVQVLTPMELPEGGGVRILLSGKTHALHCEADIVWDCLRIAGPPRARQFRVGMNFKNADRRAFERFYFGTE